MALCDNKMLLPEKGRSKNLLDGQPDFIAIHIGVNAADGLFEAINDYLTDRVFQAPLNGTAKIPGTIGDGICLLHQIGANGIVPGEFQPPGPKAGLELLHHDIRNVQEILLRQMVEGDNFIHPVQEFRPQESL